MISLSNISLSCSVKHSCIEVLVFSPPKCSAQTIRETWSANFPLLMLFSVRCSASYFNIFALFVFVLFVKSKSKLMYQCHFKCGQLTAFLFLGFASFFERYPVGP